MSNFRDFPAIYFSKLAGSNHYKGFVYSMIIGIGTDIVQNSRIAKNLERFGSKFVSRILSPAEHEFSRTPEQIAARFAAKEATVKALGTGFSQGIGFHDIEIMTLTSGQSELRLLNKALEKAQSLGVKNIHLSMSHEKEYSIAFVILEG